MREFIESGILETYLMGAASDTEAQEVQYMTQRYPEVKLALQELELDMEHVAMALAVPPPPTAWGRIEESINDLVLAPETTVTNFRPREQEKEYKVPPPGEQYIEVEGNSPYMRVHKAWKWVFGAVFLLGKVFLVCAIYFYLANRQAQQQIQELKTEINKLHK